MKAEGGGGGRNCSHLKMSIVSRKYIQEYMHIYLGRIITTNAEPSGGGVVAIRYARWAAQDHLHLPLRSARITQQRLQFAFPDFTVPYMTGPANDGMNMNTVPGRSNEEVC